MANDIIAAEPLIDPENIGRGFSVTVPFRSSLLSGRHYGETQSRGRGPGFDVDGLNAYEIGDDLRFVDWRATARNTERRPQTRQHYADITPALWSVTDMIGRRHETNADNFSERDLAFSAVMTLSQIADTQGLPTAMVATNGADLFIDKNPVRGKKHILAVGKGLGRMESPRPPQQPKHRFFGRNPAPAQETDSITLNTALQRVGQKATRSVVAVVSDFRYCDDPENPGNGWAQPLRQLASKGNDILAVELKSSWDEALPEKVGRFFIDGESAVLDPRKEEAIRERYKQNAIEQQAAIDRALASVKAAHIVLSTENPQWRTSLVGQLQSEGRRLQRKS